MFKLGVIEPETTPWESPVVLAPNMDGAYAFRVTYRQINSITVGIRIRSLEWTSASTASEKPSTCTRSTEIGVIGKYNCISLIAT